MGQILSISLSDLLDMDVDDIEFWFKQAKMYQSNQRKEEKQMMDQAGKQWKKPGKRSRR